MPLFDTAAIHAEAAAEWALGWSARLRLASSARRSTPGAKSPRATPLRYFAGGLASEMSEMPPTRFAISIFAAKSVNP